jgi:thioredoxin 1
MNKTTQIIIGLIAIIVVGGGIFSFANQNSQKAADTKKAADTAMMKKQEDEKMAMKKSEEAAMKKDSITTNDDVMKKEDSTTSVTTGDVMKKDDATKPADVMTKADGVYTPYKAEFLANADKSPTVIFFHASWCPTCKAAEADINKNLDALKASGVQILKTDYDTSTELKKQYGVTSQSTFVKVDSKGTQIKKGQGFTTLDAITSFAK